MSSTALPAAAGNPAGGGSLWFSGVSDELLARYAGRGSQRAFGIIYERYHQQLYRYCRSIVRDEADAQDALQSTFTAALGALQRHARNAPLRPWLYRIAHNESVSLLRRRTRDAQHQTSADPTTLTPSAADEAAARARWNGLLEDVAQLPERQRGALLLREMAGLSHEEIAVALGLTVGGAKQAIFEARQGLAEMEEGRAMSCEEVQRRISEGDRRVLRARRVRGHLRECAACDAFARAIPARQADLRAFAPALPSAAAATILGRALQAGSSHGSSAATGSAASGSAAGGSAAGGSAATGSAASGSAATGSAASGSAASAGAFAKAVGFAAGWKALAGAALVASTAVGVAGLTPAGHPMPPAARALMRSEQQRHAGGGSTALTRHGVTPVAGSQRAARPGTASSRSFSHTDRHSRGARAQSGIYSGRARGRSHNAARETATSSPAPGQTRSAAVHAGHATSGAGSASSSSHTASSNSTSHGKSSTSGTGGSQATSTGSSHTTSTGSASTTGAGSSNSTVHGQGHSQPASSAAASTTSTVASRTSAVASHAKLHSSARK